MAADPLAVALERLDALERKVAGLAPSEALVPTYLTIDANGLIGALFTGGVQLIESLSPFTTPDNAHSLTWFDAIDGNTPREYIRGQFLNPQHQLILASIPESAPSFAELLLTSIAGGIAGSSAIRAIAQEPLGGGWNATVLDSLGRSSFPQLPAAAKATLTYGAFTTGSNAVNIAGTNDWTVGAPSGVGFSQLTFPTRASTPTILTTIQQDGTFNGYAELNGAGAGGVQVATLNAQAAPPTLKNAIVHFLVIG